MSFAIFYEPTLDVGGSQSIYRHFSFAGENTAHFSDILGHGSLRSIEPRMPTKILRTGHDLCWSRTQFRSECVVHLTLRGVTSCQHGRWSHPFFVCWLCAGIYLSNPMWGWGAYVVVFAGGGQCNFAEVVMIGVPTLMSTFNGSCNISTTRRHPSLQLYPISHDGLLKSKTLVIINFFCITLFEKKKREVEPS